MLACRKCFAHHCEAEGLMPSAVDLAGTAVKLVLGAMTELYNRGSGRREGDNVDDDDDSMLFLVARVVAGAFELRMEDIA